MATYPVVDCLPVFEDRIHSSWCQEYRGNRLVYCIVYQGDNYEVLPLSGIDSDYVCSVRRAT